MQNPKEMWNNVNSIVFNKQKANNSIPAIKTVNSLSTDKKIIANTLNNFFKNSGKLLFDKIPPTINNLPTTSAAIAESMVLFQTRIEEITAKINKLKKSKSLKDYISTCALKKHSRKLAPILSNLINDCLANETFPDDLKCSRIVPIFKDNDPCDPNNYRPISILPSLSKIFESVICDRLNSFLNKHKVIHPNQFGFQKNSGTLSTAGKQFNRHHSKRN